MKPSRILLAAAALLSSAAFAGTADVRFIDPGSMSDLATNQWEEADTMKAITNHFQQLAQKLPADQVLHVDVLDVDLAGNWHNTRRGRIRTVADRADPPKFHLQYTLESHGQVLRQGDDRLTDINYARHAVSVRTPAPLYHEKRLIDEWFARNFAPQVAYAR
jgi:hypothetical protein